MAKNKASFERRERERAKTAKANAKRDKRQAPNEPGEAVEDTGPVADQGKVLSELAELTAKFENGDLAFDDFEPERDRLISMIHVG